MKKTIDFYDFKQAFEVLNRKDNFSDCGLEALFKWLEDYEQDTGEEVELDVIDLYLNFSELTLDDINTEYNVQFETLEDAMEWLNEETIVIPVDDESVIIQCF